MQGDIIGILNSSGTTVVSYTYDTWGKLEDISGTYATTVGIDNPFRYRGYYYDTETGLYYLNQRYYNPEWGRFINADDLLGSTGELLSHNVFAYCANNPVMYGDPSGRFSQMCAGCPLLYKLELLSLGKENARNDIDAATFDSMINDVLQGRIDVTVTSLTINVDVDVRESHAKTQNWIEGTSITVVSLIAGYALTPAVPAIAGALGISETTASTLVLGGAISGGAFIGTNILSHDSNDYVEYDGVYSYNMIQGYMGSTLVYNATINHKLGQTEPNGKNPFEEFGCYMGY